ncbi:MAG: thymidine kinase [Eubacteriales bacterium]|nr:thymidine kinase [Eubacteriales bacterium]
MAKLYFKYGAMGSSKSAQALITKFNYEELGMTVWLIKPSIDTRDGADVIKSRIGLECKAQIITPEQNIEDEYHAAGKHDVIIADEAQFFTGEQIEQLRALVDDEDLPVLCFGLRTDFLTHLFPGSQRLLELADSLTEIKTVCACGRKATVNARIDETGRVVTQGDQVFLGGNDSYIAMCHKCWKEKIRAQRG